MMDCLRSWRSFGALLFLALLTGCPQSSAPPSAEPSSEAGTTAAGPAAGTAEAPEVLLVKFDPPTLEELNAQVTWEDQLVADAMDRYIAYRKAHPAPVAVDAALALKNDSAENNEKILDTLGQLPATDADVDYDAVANRHSPMEVKQTNPILGSSVAEFTVTDLMGIGLINLDWDLIPFGNADVIKSWQSSADRLYDKIVLRDDLVWSDGTPITAHDIAFTFQAIMNPQVPAVAVRSGTAELKWVHAYDDHTVVFFHKEPLATNSENISFPIIPRHVYEKSMLDDPTLVNSKYHVSLENAPPAGGPYKMVKRVRGSEMVFERREDWYMHKGKQVRRKPYFKEVRIRIIEDANTALLALKNGEIDELELRAEQWVTQTDGPDFYNRNTKGYGEEWSYGYIGWNMQVPFFSDKRVRQAMAYALDHDQMLKNILFNLSEPGQGVFHPGSWMAPDPMPAAYKQNLDKAEDLLEQAGWVDTDGDGIRDKEINGRREKFEFTLVVPSSSDTGLKIATMFKSNLDQIGVQMNIKPTDFATMQELARGHKFQAMMAGWGSGSDPASSKNLWTTKALKEDGRNYSAYSNPEVDKLYELGERTFDRAERAKIYGKIHDILWEDQPYLWLYYRNSYYGFSKDWRGYKFSPLSPFRFAPGFYSIWKPKQK